MSTVDAGKLLEVAQRIREMRIIENITEADMAAKTEVTLEQYLQYEAGMLDFPFTFLHKCALAFGVDMTDLLEGQSAHLSSYTVTRKGEGHATAKENGIEIRNLAPMFRRKLSEPYYVRYAYDPELQDKPIHQTTHSGQEFDFILSGRLKVQVGEHVEYLSEGDSIYYNSSTPHGMIAVDGQDCLFLAVVLPGEKESEPVVREALLQTPDAQVKTVADNFIDTVEDENGVLQKISFKNEETFNFGFDVVDAIAQRTPEKLAMLHISRDKTERRFTFNDVKRNSNQVANYLKALGIKRGDKVMLVLKRHYQFWFAMVALHKLGAIAIPASNQLQAHDFEYRFQSAGVRAILCTADGDTAHQVDLAAEKCPELEFKLVVNGTREGWHTFDEEYPLYSTHYRRRGDSPSGSDLALMFFTSGTTGYPKIAAHSYKYALGHYITAKYWHGAERDGLLAGGMRRVRLRFRPLRRGGYPADVRPAQDHLFLRAADNAAHDDQAGHLAVRLLLRAPHDDGRRGAQSRGLPPVREGDGSAHHGGLRPDRDDHGHRQPHGRFAQDRLHGQGLSPV